MENEEKINEEIMNKIIIINTDPSTCFISNEEIIDMLGITAGKYFDVITSKEFQIKSMKVGAALIRAKIVQVASATAAFAMLEKCNADRKLIFQAAGLLESNVNINLNKSLEEEDTLESEVREIRNYITETVDSFSEDDDDEGEK